MYKIKKNFCFQSDKKRNYYCILFEGLFNTLGTDVLGMTTIVPLFLAEFGASLTLIGSLSSMQSILHGITPLLAGGFYRRGSQQEIPFPAFKRNFPRLRSPDSVSAPSAFSGFCHRRLFLYGYVPLFLFPIHEQHYLESSAGRLCSRQKARTAGGNPFCRIRPYHFPFQQPNQNHSGYT